MGRGLTFKPFSLPMEKTPPTSSTSMASFITPIFFSLLAISPPPTPQKADYWNYIWSMFEVIISIDTGTECLFDWKLPAILSELSKHCIFIVLHWSDRRISAIVLSERNHGQQQNLNCLEKKSSRSGLLQWFLSDTVIDWTKVILLTKSSWNHQKCSRFTVDETFLTGGKSSNKLLFETVHLATLQISWPILVDF